MTRRMQPSGVPEWRPWVIVAACGATLIMCGIVLQIVQLVVSIRQREKLRDQTGDPWNGRSLEWATASPPPAFNFAVLPQVTGADAYWELKQRRLGEEPEYPDIQIPPNSPTASPPPSFPTLCG